MKFYETFLDVSKKFSTFQKFFRHFENLVSISKILPCPTSIFFKISKILPCPTSIFFKISKILHCLFGNSHISTSGHFLADISAILILLTISKKGQNKENAQTLRISTFRGRDLSQSREENFLFMIWILTITFLSAFNPQTPLWNLPFWRSHDRRL